MIDIDITRFITEAAPMDYSASVMEIGANAGRDTWRHAVEDAHDYDLLDTYDKRVEFRAHIKGFGAWTDEEIAAFSTTELNALLMQMISGDIRNGETDRIWSDAGQTFYSLGD
jgi:hypothetical protein